MKLWTCAIFLGLLAPSMPYVHSITDEDREYLEKHIIRKKRDSNFYKAPINFANLPRLDVVTVPHEPYTFIETDPSGATVTRGYMIDLMYLVGRRLDMQVHFYTPEDNRYGSKKDGNWNGMMGEVIKRENYIAQNMTASGLDTVGQYGADIAAAALTITADRELDVDFVKPFAHLGLTALLKKAETDEAQGKWPFDFDIFKPLDISVWMTVIILGIVVWVFLYLMNRFNPYEYGKRVENNLATERDGELFNVAGSFWFMFTVLQWQGYERSPRCLASKILGAFWMLFVTLFLVVFTGAYINNLFWASMVHGVDPNQSPVGTLEQLASGVDGYEYGTVNGGSTYQYLTKVAKGEEYDVISEYLKSHPENMVASTKAGVEMIRSKPKYAFICETMSAKYEANLRPCDLTTLRVPFGTRSYGLAVAKNSPLLEDLHVIILEMLEEGDIEALEKKWFEIKGECWNVTKAEEEATARSEVLFNKPKSVSFVMMLQVFGIMFVGILISVLVALGEILWFNYRGKYESANRQRSQQPSIVNNDALVQP